MIEFGVKRLYTSGRGGLRHVAFGVILSMAIRISDFRNVSSSNERNTRASQLIRFCRVQRIKRFLLGLVVGFFASTFALTLFFSFVPVPLTPLMMIRLVDNGIHGKPLRFNKDWVSIEEISPRLQSAVIASEDFKFFEHNGFDWDAIQKAIKHNRQGKKVRGASTISQQVAKNVFLWPARSWTRKILETYFTGLIELSWSKKRILEVYLNVAEFGDGVYGVEAAAQRYFNKTASEVNSAEAALMAAVLPNPRILRIDRPSRYVRFRQTKIQRRMRVASRIVKASNL